MFFNFGRKSPSRVSILPTFVGVLLIAGSYAYYSYKFSRFNVVDFDKTVFYKSDDIFIPKKDTYAVFIFSSKMGDYRDKIDLIDKKYTVLAIDMAQQKIDDVNRTIFLRAGTNTILKIIQGFNIYDVPSVFLIEKLNNNSFKQISGIKKL